MQQLSGDRHQLKKKKERERQVEKEPQPQPTPTRRRGWYQILFSPDAQLAYDALGANLKKGIEQKLARLGDWPEVTGVGPMFGEASGYFRVKFWDIRAVFSVDEQNGTIVVEKIGQRDSVYDEFHPDSRKSNLY